MPGIQKEKKYNLNKHWDTVSKKMMDRSTEEIWTLHLIRNNECNNKRKLFKIILWSNKMDCNKLLVLGVNE